MLDATPGSSGLTQRGLRRMMYPRPQKRKESVRKKKSDWTFVLNAKTTTQGILVKGAKVTVY